MRYRPSFPAAVSLEPVGSVAVVDLESVCELYGRDTVPFPLGRSRPVGSLWLATRDVDPIEYRLDAGDLRSVRGWVEALMRPDVCVECRVHCSVGDRPDRRLHGVLADGSGFLAVQGSDEGVDIVDVYAVPPPELAAVVADTVGLVGAGAHQRIAVTGHTDQVPEAVDARDEADDLSFLVDHTVHPEPVPVVDDRDVVATGTVQTRTEPAAHVDLVGLVEQRGPRSTDGVGPLGERVADRRRAVGEGAGFALCPLEHQDRRVMGVPGPGLGVRHRGDVGAHRCHRVVDGGPGVRDGLTGGGQ